jgi:hypothetical protein
MVLVLADIWGNYANGCPTKRAEGFIAFLTSFLRVLQLTPWRSQLSENLAMPLLDDLFVD